MGQIPNLRRTNRFLLYHHHKNILPLTEYHFALWPSALDLKELDGNFSDGKCTWSVQGQPLGLSDSSWQTYRLATWKRNRLLDFIHDLGNRQTAKICSVKSLSCWQPGIHLNKNDRFDIAYLEESWINAHHAFDRDRQSTVGKCRCSGKILHQSKERGSLLSMLRTGIRHFSPTVC